MKVSDKKIKYLNKRVKACGGSVEELAFALALAKRYKNFRVRRDLSGNIFFIGVSVHGNESFYLRRGRPDADYPPFETVWGVVQ